MIPLCEGSRKGKFMEPVKQRLLGQEGEGNVDLLLNGYRASIWDDEKVLEMERSDGCTTL